MKASVGSVGRVFVIRLEEGDRVPDCIEQFAADNGISTGHALMIGGIGSGQVVVGPRDSGATRPDPMLLPIDGAHEVVGVGIIAPDKNGRPIMHMHASLGRSGQTVTGCVRPGVFTWCVGEVVLYEIVGTTSVRRPDSTTGFTLLEVDE